MTETLLGILVGQGLTIIVGLITMYVRLNNKIGTVESKVDVALTKVDSLETRRSEQREDHDTLRVQVQGISRTVAQHEAIIQKAS